MRPPDARYTMAVQFVLDGMDTLKAWEQAGKPGGANVENALHNIRMRVRKEKKRRAYVCI